MRVLLSDGTILALWVRHISRGFGVLLGACPGYAIQIYRELLTPAAKARFEEARLRQQSDVALSEPQWWALYNLLQVAPYPPPSGIAYGFNLAAMPDQARIWLAWIRKNEPTLKKLQPTGAGVDFSGKACKSRPKM